jgi:hypothetical protein
MLMGDRLEHVHSVKVELIEPLRTSLDRSLEFSMSTPGQVIIIDESTQMFEISRNRIGRMVTLDVIRGKSDLEILIAMRGYKACFVLQGIEAARRVTGVQSHG